MRKKRLKGRSGERIRTPLVMQTHASECGAACLGSVLAWFGRWVPFSELREVCEVSRDGSNAASLANAAQRYGLECTGYRLTGNQLGSLRLPLILFWEYRHFVVLEGWKDGWFFLNDPAVGRRKLSDEEFQAGFGRTALAFERGENFEPGGERPDPLRRLAAWFEGCRSDLTKSLCLSLALALLTLVPAFGLGEFVDRVLGEDPALRDVVIGLLLGSAALAYGVSWLRAKLLQRLATRLSVSAGNRCLSHFLRLRMEYFLHRVEGDLVSRLRSIDDVVRSLTEHVIGVSLELAMSAIFLAAMFALQPELALFTLVLALLNFGLLRLVMRWRDDHSHVWRSERSKLVGAGAAMLEQVELLRSTGAEDTSFVRWSAAQAREVSARQQFIEYSHLCTASSVLCVGLGVAAVLGYGTTQVMAGQMTTGGLLAFLVVSGLFMRPISRFAELADHLQELESNLYRLDDILLAERDRIFTGGRDASGRQDGGSIAALDGRMRLTGLIELRNVSYGYRTGTRPLLENLNLIIKPGQRVAVVGPSGSGKSTLAWLIAGLFQPWSGEILFDGRSRDEIPLEIVSRSLAMVDQTAVLFSGTVRDNITLWNAATTDDSLTRAAKDAQIHDEILRRPLGYESRVDEDGRNFSGGQRQRLEIARALVGNPTALLLDEATGALDAVTEENIDRALRRRGCSCLIVAHRLSTVRDADEIVVLDKGRVVQRGTHDVLMKEQDGLYRHLVLAG